MPWSVVVLFVLVVSEGARMCGSSWTACGI